jgi:hypothetical protein
MFEVIREYITTGKIWGVWNWRCFWWRWWLWWLWRLTFVSVGQLHDKTLSTTCKYITLMLVLPLAGRLECIILFWNYSNSYALFQHICFTNHIFQCLLFVIIYLKLLIFFQIKRHSKLSVWCFVKTALTSEKTQCKWWCRLMLQFTERCIQDEYGCMSRLNMKPFFFISNSDQLNPGL